MARKPAFGYQLRPVRFHELWEQGGWRLKLYTIQYRGAPPVAELLPSAREAAARHLRAHPTRHEHYGVGFACVHAGQGENQIILDRWINRNELLHYVLVSPPSSPAEWLAPPDDHNSVCIWELYLQGFERDAWIECVVANPAGPDFDDYLARRLTAEI